jgi:hypothetical protein
LITTIHEEFGMISIVGTNPYRRAHEFLAQSKWRREYKLQEFLLPSLELQSAAFRDGALTQLLACVADLRVWASQYRRLGKGEFANELDQFARDWEDEAKSYLDLTQNTAQGTAQISSENTGKQ